MSDDSTMAQLKPHLSPEGSIVDPARYAGRRACVVGAGLGGLALAIRLQSSGIATTLVEARERPGGKVDGLAQHGYTFTHGPGFINDGESLRQLWRLSGRDMAQDVELIPIEPFCRFQWEDGTNFDYSGDAEILAAEIARINPADVTGFEHLLEYSSSLMQLHDGIYAQGGRHDLRALARSIPALARRQAWRSCHKCVAHYIEDERLRQAFSSRSLLNGLNPLAAGPFTLQYLKQERDGGMWWPRGGFGAISAAMLRHFKHLGGTARMHDPAVCIHTIGNHACEVETLGGWREKFDAVASNTDIMHCYRDLLGHSHRGREYARKLTRRDFTPSQFMVHFAIEGKWPGIPHHSILFGPRYHAWIADIFDHGVLPADFMIHLHHPSITDPSLAPAGQSIFCATIAVANMGRLTLDWEIIAPLLEQRILDEVGRRLIPDIHSRLRHKFSYTPRDFAMDFNAHLGCGFGPAPQLLPSGHIKVPNRDAMIENLYLVGAGAYPGAGMPSILQGARLAANLMLKDLERR